MDSPLLRPLPFTRHLSLSRQPPHAIITLFFPFFFFQIFSIGNPKFQMKEGRGNGSKEAVYHWTLKATCKAV